MNKQKKEPKPCNKFWLKFGRLKIVIEVITSAINLIKVIM